MIQECCICGVRYGEKEPYEDKSVTHGFCSSCLEKELKKLEEFKKTEKKVINMPRKKLITHSVRFGKSPTVGDFVLWDDDIWIITSMKGKMVNVESVSSGDVYENMYIRSLEETDIRTWEFS